MKTFLVLWADTGKALVDADTASEAMDIADAHLYKKWLKTHTARLATLGEMQRVKQRFDRTGVVDE